MREEFEAWISSPPYEKQTKRYSDDPVKYAWPGNYLDVNVELAWQAWQQAAKSNAVR